MRAIVASVLLVVACGGPPPPGPLARVAATDAGVDAASPPLPRACPATYDAVPVGQVCDANRAGSPPSPATGLAGLVCGYPEGGCTCAAPVECGGMEQSPEYYASLPITWQCARTPPAIRPDGCPGTEPHGACSDEGRTCSYGDCCFVVLTCRGGTWIETGGGCPP